MAHAFDILMYMLEVASRPELEPVVDEASALKSEAQSKIAQDPVLFARVKTVYQQADRTQLTPEEVTLLKNLHGFCPAWGQLAQGRAGKI